MAGVTAPLAGLLALAVIVVAAARPAPVVITANPAPAPTVMATELPTTEALPALAEGDSPALRVLAYIVVAVLALLTAALVGLVVFRIARYRAAALRALAAAGLDRPAPAEAPAAGLGMAGAALDEGELADAVTSALARLDRAATPSDAVVLAWLELEAAAARCGAARDPAQTPTEFTAALLAATRAPGPATATLRGLYQRVRFGGEAATPQSVAAARAALEAIARALEPDPAAAAAAADLAGVEA
jgi:hypothetical protein